MKSSEAPIEISILMQKYALLREEVMFHFKASKLHTRYFHAFFAACLTVGWYLYFVAKEEQLTEKLSTIGMTQRELLIFLIGAFDITSYYYAFDILDCYFCMFLAGARLANIEEQINSGVGSTVLLWESKFQSETVAKFGPSRMAITTLQMIIVFLISFCFPLVVYGLLWSSSSCTERLLLAAAALVSTGMLVWFAYSCYDIFSDTKKEKMRSVIKKLEHEK